MFTANTISRRSRRAAAQLRIIMLATIWAPLSCQSSLVDASFLESGEQVDLLESALYDTPSWLLADFLFTFPFAGDGYLRASEYPLLQRFTPTAGLLQVCFISRSRFTLFLRTEHGVCVVFGF